MSNAMPRVAIVNRVMPHYRLPVMTDLSERLEGGLTLIYSRSIVSGKKRIESCISDSIPTRLMDFRLLPIPVLARRYTIGYHRRLTAALDEVDPQVVITEGESNLLNSIIASHFCRRRRLPLIWWGCGRVRNKPVTCARLLSKPLLKRLLRNAAAVIGYSSYACSYYRDTYGLSPDKMFVAPNSLHPTTVPDYDRQDAQRVRTDLGIPPEAPVLLYVGALTPPKRPDLFFDIFSDLRQSLPDLHAILVGDGPMMAELQSRSDSDDRFHIAGEVIDGVHAYFHACDLFIMPGLGGLALQQAMMCAKPVVCTVADGTELDLVRDGKNGCFIEPGQPTGLWTERISAVVQNRALREDMGAESKRIIDAEYNSEIMVRCIIDAIGHAMK